MLQYHKKLHIKPLIVQLIMHSLRLCIHSDEVLTDCVNSALVGLLPPPAPLRPSFGDFTMFDVISDIL